MPFLPGTGSRKLDETLELDRGRAGPRAPTRRSSSRRTTRAPPRRRSTSGTRRSPGSSPTCRSSPTTCPSRTAVDIAPETVQRLLRDYDNFVGVKETTKDFEHFSRVLHALRARLLVWSGIELLCLPLLALGGAGLRQRAVSNLAPGRRGADVRAVGGGRLRRRPGPALPRCTRWSTCCSSRPTRRPAKWVLAAAGPHRLAAPSGRRWSPPPTPGLCQDPRAARRGRRPRPAIGPERRHRDP